MHKVCLQNASTPMYGNLLFTTLLQCTKASSHIVGWTNLYSLYEDNELYSFLFFRTSCWKKRFGQNEHFHPLLAISGLPLLHTETVITAAAMVDLCTHRGGQNEKKFTWK